MNIVLSDLKLKKTVMSLLAALVILLGAVALDAAAAEKAPAAGGGHGGDMGAIGQKLANPLGDLWSLTFNWQALQFFDGDVNPCHYPQLCSLRSRIT